MKVSSATSARAGRMCEHPWAAHGMGERHPEEPLGWECSLGCVGYDTVSGGEGGKEGIFNADVKADVQGNRQKIYQDDGLQQSVRTYVTESQGYIEG